MLLHLGRVRIEFPRVVLCFAAAQLHLVGTLLQKLQMRDVEYVVDNGQKLDAVA